jgi:hypothetical protein
MPVHLPISRATRIAAHLTAEFDGVLPRAVVEAEVKAAEYELRGQVPPGSLDELLHRLAAYRLHERAGTRPRVVPPQRPAS